MPGKGNAKGHAGQGRGNKADDGDGRIGHDEDVVHGRSESSPGHLKRQAGEQSARDFAPGRSEETGRGTTLPEGEPEEMGED